MQTVAEQTKPKAPGIQSSKKSSLKITRLGEHVGAEATGVDLTKPIDEDTRKRLNDAVIEHIALVVRDQTFTPAQFLEASRVFGTPIARPNGSHSLDDVPIVHQVSSRQVDTMGIAKRTGTNWHTDHTNLPEPTNYTILYPLELPGGGTSVCSMRAGYLSLPPELRKRVDAMQTLNVTFGSAVRSNGRGVADQKEQQARDKSPPVIHPLVRTHPVAGTKALYFNPTKTETIVGMTPDEAQDFMELLVEKAVKPEFVYTHQWRMGDMFLWDNRSSLHKAGEDYEIVDGRHRTLYRIVTAGDKPF